MATNLTPISLPTSIELGNPDPLDSREMFTTKSTAEESAANAGNNNYYVGQQICVVQSGVPSWYYIDQNKRLAPLGGSSNNTTSLSSDVVNITKSVYVDTYRFYKEHSNGDIQTYQSISIRSSSDTYSVPVIQASSASVEFPNNGYTPTLLTPEISLSAVGMELTNCSRDTWESTSNTYGTTDGYVTLNNFITNDCRNPIATYTEVLDDWDSSQAPPPGASFGVDIYLCSCTYNRYLVSDLYDVVYSELNSEGSSGSSTVIHVPDIPLAKNFDGSGKCHVLYNQPFGQTFRLTSLEQSANVKPGLYAVLVSLRKGDPVESSWDTAYFSDAIYVALGYPTTRDYQIKSWQGASVTLRLKVEFSASAESYTGAAQITVSSADYDMGVSNAAGIWSIGKLEVKQAVVFE